MSRSEFIERHRHELAGIVLDAAMSNRHGSELALFCRSMMQRIDARLGEIYADLQPKPAPNGAPAQQPKASAK